MSARKTKESEYHSLLMANLTEFKQDIKNDLAEHRKDVQEIRILIQPMVDVYSTTMRLGKWTSKLLLMLSVVVGLVISIAKLLQNKNY